MRYSFPPRLCCPKCLGADLGWMELEKRGTLHSWTEVFLAGPEFDTPFLLGLIDLEGGGGRLMARITGVEAGELQIGMPVKIGFFQGDEEFSVYYAAVEGGDPA
ncbi:MAG: Zn-ribbon domain-containing OB-fold protein [Bacillota bacterium]